MRIILKIIAAPFVLVLTLLVAALSFLLSLSAGVLSILASLLGIRADHGLCHFALWSAGSCRVAAGQAGRSQLRLAGLHHRLILLVTVARRCRNGG